MEDPAVQIWRYDWLSRGRSAKTFVNMLYELENFRSASHTPLNGRTRADCVGFILAAPSEPRARWRWRALRSYYGAQDGHNPMEGVRGPREAEPHTKGLTEATYRALLSTCAGGAPVDRRDSAMIATLWHTGMRRSELAALLVEDLGNQTIAIRKSKTAKPRVVPIAAEAHVAILRWLAIRDSDHERMWLGRKGPLTHEGTRQMLERRAGDADVQVSAHQFRRAFAVRWLGAGGSQASLKLIMGWSSDAMVSRYSRHAAESLAADEYRRVFG